MPGNPYVLLSKDAESTVCQLDSDDTRAIYRLSQWMTAFCEVRRQGNAPPRPCPSAPSAGEAYYMVSFFMELKKKHTSDFNAYADVDKRFDKVVFIVLN